MISIDKDGTHYKFTIDKGKKMQLSFEFDEKHITSYHVDEIDEQYGCQIMDNCIELTHYGFSCLICGRLITIKIRDHNILYKYRITDGERKYIENALK